MEIHPLWMAECVFCSEGGRPACRSFPFLGACLIQRCWKQIRRPRFKIQHYSHLERPCVVVKGSCEWFWVNSEAACGLFVLRGPCVIQRCWNRFICPSPPCWSNYPCVTAPRSSETRLLAHAVSGRIISAAACPHKTATSTGPPARHNTGLKGSCPSCGVRMRSLYTVWTTSELVQWGKKKIPCGCFLFWNCQWEKHAEHNN